MTTSRILAALAMVCSNLPALAAPFVYVATRDEGVSVIDIATHTVVATIPLPGCGAQHIAFDPTGALAYASCMHTREVRLIDTATNAAGAALSVCSTSWVSSFSVLGTQTYASCFGPGGSVAVRDLATNALI